MKRSKRRLVTTLKEKGVWGTCSCGGDLLYFSDHGIKCVDCGKLYATWFLRRRQKVMPDTSIKPSAEPKLRECEVVVPKLPA